MIHNYIKIHKHTKNIKIINKPIIYNNLNFRFYAMLINNYAHSKIREYYYLFYLSFFLYP